MTTYKVSELSGPLLDAAVAKAQGFKFRIEWNMTRTPHATACWLCNSRERIDFDAGLYRPSKDWAQGGPILEREACGLETFLTLLYGAETTAWIASTSAHAKGPQVRREGVTPLIAAMRCYVTCKIGDEVELP